MVSLMNLQSRKDSRVARALGSQQDAPDYQQGGKEKELGYVSGSDSDTMSLEARNEKEVQENPDTVTATAQEGQKKAEAAALVWGSKKVAFMLYAW